MLIIQTYQIFKKKSILKFNLGKNKYNHRSGEIGELILFILLESKNICDNMIMY